MESGCVGCNQKIIEQNAANEKVIEQAQARANEDGQWYSIYTDEFGRDQYIRTDIALAEGYTVRRHVSPKL